VMSRDEKSERLKVKMYYDYAESAKGKKRKRRRNFMFRSKAHNI
jgi:hypothetical protein